MTPRLQSTRNWRKRSSERRAASVFVAAMNRRERQRGLLRKMGVDVWTLRGGGVEVAGEQPVQAEAGEPTPPEAPVDDAAQSDESPESLDRVEQAVSVCRKCELHQTRTNTVFGCGNPEANWLFIGEAPGHNEDLQGQPFVGRAGKLLDMMLAALGMKREQVFIANVLKCRPPDNRDPLPGEIEQCEPYLHQQLALIKPKVIVALGRVSAQSLLKTTAPLGKLRNQTHHYGPRNIPLIATYHPAYLLRSPGQKAAAWEDLWQAREIVEGL